MPEDVAAADIRSRMVSGVVWQGLGQASSQLIVLVAIAVLARLVSPAEFGVVGMATILTGLVARLGDLGLGSAVIQRKSLSQPQLSSVFWAVVALGAVSWLVAAALAPLFAQFMREPVLVLMIPAASAMFLVSSLGTTHRYLLLRDMRFKPLAFVEIAAVTAYAVGAIGLALLGFGAWSIVVGHLLQAVVAVLVIWILSSWRPSRVFDRAGMRGLMSFGVRAWAGGLLGYMQESGDYLVIGRALGPTPLGYYTMAFNLANVPRTRLGSVVSMVAFTGFSRIQDDRGQVQRGFLRVMRYIALVSFPLLAGMAILATEFVLVVYGPRWSASVLPLMLLSLAAIPGSLTAAMPAILLAQNRPDLHLRLSLASTMTFFAAVVAGVAWGISGVAAMLVFHSAVFFALTGYFTCRVVGLSFRALFGSLLQPAIATGVMALFVAAARLGLQSAGAGDLAVLLSGVLVGAAVYLATAFVMRLPEVGEVREMLSSRRRSSHRATTTTNGVSTDARAAARRGDSPVEPLSRVLEPQGVRADGGRVVAEAITSHKEPVA